MKRRLSSIPRRRLAAFLLASMLACSNLFADIVVVGDALAGDARFAAQAKAGGQTIRRAAPLELSRIDPASVDALVLASETPLPPELRRPISEYLAHGGRVAVVGAHLFDYEPRPDSSIVLSHFAKPEAFRIVEIARKIANAEPLVRETIQGPDREPALLFRTVNRGMESFFVELDATKARARRNNVLRFWAKGDCYADLASVVICDTAGHNWHGFVPLANGDWRRYTLSLADCLPEGWKNANEPYPLLDPAAIATIRIGINRNTVWNEKPMSLALGTVELTHNQSPRYVPTSALLALRLPFLEIGINTPTWLFDPFVDAKYVSPKARLAKAESVSNDTLPMPPEARFCPVPHLEHPGPRMGTDHNKNYILKFERETRRLPLWKAREGADRILGTVAELRLAATGPQKGSALLLYGIPSKALLANRELAESFYQAVLDLATKPMIAAVTPHSKASEDGKTAVPQLEVVLQNPTRAAITGTVRANAADGQLTGETEIAIPARGSAVAKIELPAPAREFPFARFDWAVTLQTPKGGDTLRDAADVERGLLHALGHMVSTQRQFPDGRISNHYFGDAYGVRAMYAYLDLLKREPARLKKHEELRADLPEKAIETCADRFFDMLVERQTKEGAVPMGYGENTPVYNVADAGQMALSVGQVIPLIGDEARRTRYLHFCTRFAAWAETFYIDEARSAELAKKMPAKKREIKAGHYGLGLTRGLRQQNGPSWVMPDVLGAQIVLSYLDPLGDYGRIAARNWRAYLDASYPSSGYFQAEALVWAWLSTNDPRDRDRIAASLRDDFLKERIKGDLHEMYERGARSNLNALPLLYYRKYFEDTPTVRSLLLKYIWAFASEEAPNGMRRVAEAFPKPQHGESLAAVKQASTGALWAMELIDPGSSFLRVPGFPRAAP